MKKNLLKVSIKIYLPYAALILGIFWLGACGTNTKLDDDNTGFQPDYGSDETFEVISWNLREFPWNGESTIRELAAIIPQLKVDVIAFQEINDKDSFLELARRIPHYSAYVYNATSSWRLAYLYDERTVDVKNCYTIYNGETNPFPRPPYVLELSWQGEDLIIVNNHFKAFGDNHIDETDPWDEERRRRLACEKLDTYIRTYWNEEKVIVLGDLNDQIHEPPEYNVFLPFLNKPQEYLFADMEIAQNLTPDNVSYPPSFSHIDHILITNELFSSFSHPQSSCNTLQMELMMGSWHNYYNLLSDHRPVAIKLFFQP